jgi:Uma2 family endonuclease
MAARTFLAPGPFRAEQIREGSPYELSNGHPILCLPTGRRGGVSNLIGGEVLETDPAVKSAGVDIGFSKDPGHLRAPDVSVGDFANEPGWAPGAPPLAVEYADTGQDEGELATKIAELLGAGTKYVWVVRLTGPRRVEVHERGRAMRLASPGEELVAKGILQNPVPVLALYDRDAAHEATLRNLLQRRGYASLEALRAEGEAQGKIEGEIEGRRASLFQVLEARKLPVSKAQRAQILAEQNLEVIARWLTGAAIAASTGEALAPPKPAAPRQPRRR